MKHEGAQKIALRAQSLLVSAQQVAVAPRAALTRRAESAALAVQDFVVTVPELRPCNLDHQACRFMNMQICLFCSYCRPSTTRPLTAPFLYTHYNCFLRLRTTNTIYKRV